MHEHVVESTVLEKINNLPAKIIVEHAEKLFKNCLAKSLEKHVDNITNGGAQYLPYSNLFGALLSHIGSQAK